MLPARSALTWVFVFFREFDNPTTPIGLRDTCSSPNMITLIVNNTFIENFHDNTSKPAQATTKCAKNLDFPRNGPNRACINSHTPVSRSSPKVSAGINVL